MESLIKSYNRAIENLINLKEIVGFKISLQEFRDTGYFTKKDLIYIMQSISIKSEKVLGILNSKIGLNLTNVQENTLNSIRNQIKKLNLEDYYERNIDFAINHFEKGDFLACSLISSRIIAFCMDQITFKDEETSNKKLNKSNDEKRLDYLVDIGIVEKNQKDQKNRIIKYARKARDFLIHDIKIFPDASDSMSLLGDCVDI